MGKQEVYPGFSLTPYLESFTPTFGLGTPVFPRISSNLHCGTPTFSKRCLWDSYFQNPSENPGVPIHSHSPELLICQIETCTCNTVIHQELKIRGVLRIIER